ncbi:penicillin-binding transpeptidase domain-containing protein [Pseudoduganella danionis]|uniref:Beta-lactamase n=1 Tax=Pseudoduganella danionis TaxID=1890295 RepID=A0ABW9SRL5_9BURK|nr:penicillin-binding transpeptidase domain-containing protein [Pseudoduganella danionis]MTW33339.1 class D beta-lactamase [Pseudoduganella danionis]
MKPISFTILLAAAPLAYGAATTCNLLAESANDSVIRQEGQCDIATSPMSTFKLAISLMAYDAQILVDEHQPVWPFKPGYVDWRAEWKQDIAPAQWMAWSVVWYSQQITQRLGEQRLVRYVRQFSYGNQDVAGGLTKAWLNSSLQITPRGQLAFLGRLVRRELGVTAQAYMMTAQIAHHGKLANGWEVVGKTGAGSYGAHGKLGWYVGWASKSGRTVTFVQQRLESDEALDGPAGFRARDAMLAQLPAWLDAL